jgi:hypothetical protein
LTLVRYADRPDLRERRFAELSGATFPEYMHHNEPGNRYWGRLYTDFPDFQVTLLEGEELLAEAHALPLPWDGTLADLPAGWEEGFVRGMEAEEPPTSLMANRDQRRAVTPGPATLEQDDRDLQGERSRCGTRVGDRARPSDAEGALPTHPHRALPGMAPRRRLALRSVAAHPRARRR